MTERLDDRCPRCSALVRVDSPWCTLCYADLRPQLPAYAASVAEAPSTAPASAPVSPAPSPWAPDAPAFDPLTAPFSVLEAASLPAQAPVAADPAPDATAAYAVESSTAPVPEAGKLVGWPCTRCETLVPLDELSCPTCGSSFLAEARGEPDLFSRFGRGGVSKTTQAMIIGVGSAAFIIVVMGLLYVASLFL